MVVSPLALDWLDDDRANVYVPLLDELVNLALGFLFTLNHIGFAFRLRKRKIDARTRHAGPIKFREQIRFARIGIGQAHGVAGPPMERVPEMQNLCAAFAVTGG